MTDAQVVSWLEKRGYAQPMLVRYGEWLGVLPGWQRMDEDGTLTGAASVPVFRRRTHSAIVGSGRGIWATP